MSSAQKILTDAINSTQQKKLTRSIFDAIAICGHYIDDQEEEMRDLFHRGKMAEVEVAELAIWRMGLMLDELIKIKENAR